MPPRLPRELRLSIPLWALLLSRSQVGIYFLSITLMLFHQGKSLLTIEKPELHDERQFMLGHSRVRQLSPYTELSPATEGLFL